MQSSISGQQQQSSSSSGAALPSCDKLEDQQCMNRFMHEVIDLLQLRCKAPTPAPASKSNSMSDSSSDSCISDSGCSSAEKQEPERKKQASLLATVASRAAELGTAREQLL
eukprot:scaffold54036_cov16-Tisochrysis_lutea.AAC.1